MRQITGVEAVKIIKSGKTLIFPDSNAMKGVYYDDDLTYSFFFVTFEDQHIRTNWNEAHIANRVWLLEEK